MMMIIIIISLLSEGKKCEALKFQTNKLLFVYHHGHLPVHGKIPW
jgi:hypothetical protein